MNLQSQIESLLFVSIKPVPLKDLAAAVGADQAEVKEALDKLAQSYRDSGSGWELINSHGQYQLASAGENAALVKEFLKSEMSGELSQPSLEALTIIAYRGPISKLELEKIRGVNCSLIIRNLLLRGLIEEKFEKAKNENYYQTTADFIRFLGIGSLEELPDYQKLRQSAEIEAALEGGREEENLN